MSEPHAREYLTPTDSEALYGKPGLKLLLVETPLCRAVIAEQGAQILEFQAEGREALLWVSPAAQFEAGKAVRGGIPVCLPWFGINRDDPGKPKHGLVRTEPWQKGEHRMLPSGELELVFTYHHPGSELFTAAFDCIVTMRLGRELHLQLALTNLSAEVATFSWAWHSYFAVDNVREIEVEGLDGRDYLDNTCGLERRTQHGSLTFPGEVDRVYEGAPAYQRIVTRNPISTTSEHCRSVITWNPGPELAATLADVGEHYREFVCVEHGNAFADSWVLESGTTARASLTLKR